MGRKCRTNDHEGAATFYLLREVDAGAKHLSFLFPLGSEPIGYMALPTLRMGLLCSVNHSGNNFIEIPRDVSIGIPKPVRLNMKTDHHRFPCSSTVKPAGLQSEECHQEGALDAAATLRTLALS